jgi:hypothetical protein
MSIRITTFITGLILSTSAMAELDSDDATVSLTIGAYASVTGLDDFSLTADGLDGAANATYSGSDSFNLESNGQVRVTMTGGDLSHGSDSVSTTYELDSNGTSFDTTADSVHNANHTLEAQATLGSISSQKAGNYSADLTITVSAI